MPAGITSQRRLLISQVSDDRWLREPQSAEARSWSTRGDPFPGPGAGRNVASCPGRLLGFGRASRALVYVPATSPRQVLEIGTRVRRASTAPGVYLVGVEGDRVVYRVGSGSYEFRVRAPEPPRSQPSPRASRPRALAQR
jgi:hypothetical protein